MIPPRPAAMRPLEWIRAVERWALLRALREQLGRELERRAYG